MDDDFPYDRIGERDHIGRTKARFLNAQQSDSEYLKAEADDGVWAYKKGSFLEVENEADDAVPVRAFYFVGSANDVRRSTTARGNFTEIASAPATAYLSQRLVPIGNGWAYRMGNFTDLGFVTDISGNDAHVHQWQFFWTRDGITYELRSTEPLAFGTALGTLGINYPGRIYDTLGAFAGGKAQHAMLIDSRNPDDLRQYRIMFLQESVNETFGAMVFEAPGKIVRAVGMERIGAKAFLAFTSGFVPDVAPDLSYDATDTPTLDFHLSTDNGETWTRLGVPPSMTAHMETWSEMFGLGIGAEILYLNTYFYAAPLNPEFTLVSVHYPYVANPGDPDNPPYYGFRVAKFMVQTVNGAFTDLEHVDFESGVEAEPDYAFKGFPYFERGLVPVRGGVLIMRPTGDHDTYRTTPPKIGFTDNGFEPLFYTMPFIAAYTGVPMALDRNTIVCAMFDGEYSLYQSRNRGQTWTKRATINPSAIPPPVDSGIFSEMDPYTAIAWLRENGRAVNTTPAIPWFSDERIAA